MDRHLRVVGIVQGVGYRAAFARQADALGLSGWVRNRIDGSVESIISGTPDALDRMTEWARHGPAGAQVTAVSITETAGAETAADRFEILPTK